MRAINFKYFKLTQFLAIPDGNRAKVFIHIRR